MTDVPKILYEYSGITGIYKPAGLLVHAQKKFHCTPTLVSWLKEEYEHPPAPVHRLDSPTSGIILATERTELAKVLSSQFREGKVKKVYRAIVRGWPEDSGLIEIPLKKERSDQMMEALTEYRCLERREYPWANQRFASSRYALVELYPGTGRFHQLRRHMARISHPILGDTSHGDLRHNRIYQEHTEISRLLLHAWKIQFTHPATGEILEWSAPLPEALNLP